MTDVTPPSASTRAPARRRRTQLPLERLRVVEKMLMAPACTPHRKIERELAKRWGLGRRQIRDYIKRVYDDWKSCSDDDREHNRVAREAAFEDIYQRAMKTGDLSAANAAQDRLARIQGVMGPAEVSLTGSITTTAAGLHGDPEKDRARLEELRKREAERKKDGS